jgi:hypothetical protein
MSVWRNVLFRVIHRICEDLGESPPPHSISAFKDDAMTICMNEVFIQQDFPAGMKQLSTAVGLKRCHTSLQYVRQITQNVFDTIRKLTQSAVEDKYNEHRGTH